MTRVIHGLESVRPLDASVVAIGNFDGVNRAHQHLLAQAAMFAATGDHPLVVLTFEPHPLTIVAPDRAPDRLTDESEKIRLLGEAGADIIVVARAEPKLLAVSAEDFVRESICPLFHPVCIVEGANFGFGRGRQGNNETLRRLGPELGFDLCVVEPLTFEMEGEPSTQAISSTLVRRLLSEGNVRHATLCLGRPYVLQGTIAEANRRGRDLGFPTANLQVQDQLIPAEGVYAGLAEVRSKRYAAAVSIGHTPTFDGQTLQIEAHLLDFEGDLVGDTMRLEFHQWLRAQRKFDSPAALVAQIHTDVDAVRKHVTER